MHISTDVFVSNCVHDIPHGDPPVNPHGDSDEISVTEEGKGEL